jgi:hypothetical protein
VKRNLRTETNNYRLRTLEYAAHAVPCKADHYSANVLPVICKIQGSGVQSLRGVARALTARGVRTPRGGAWNPAQVSTILQRSR